MFKRLDREAVQIFLDTVAGPPPQDSEMHQRRFSPGFAIARKKEGLDTIGTMQVMAETMTMIQGALGVKNWGWGETQEAGRKDKIKMPKRMDFDFLTKTVFCVNFGASVFSPGHSSPCQSIWKNYNPLGGCCFTYEPKDFDFYCKLMLIR